MTVYSHFNVNENLRYSWMCCNSNTVCAHHSMSSLELHNVFLKKFPPLPALFLSYRREGCEDEAHGYRHARIRRPDQQRELVRDHFSSLVVFPSIWYLISSKKAIIHQRSR